MFAAAKSIRESLERTRQTLTGKIANLFGQNELTETTFDELEATLIQSDLGAYLADEVIADLERRAEDEGMLRLDMVKSALRKVLRAQLGDGRQLNLNATPTVIALVGVNGSGKTTSAAKLARYFQRQNRSVMLGAADTFRAAAVEQLQVWGERLEIPVIYGQPNADPGAVAHDAVAAAVSRKTEVLIVDTAGRLQTKFNLMEELKKVCGVMSKVLPGAPHEVLLVLDASTGQNALSQAKAFKDAVGVTGVVLSKLDGSAKGGMTFSIKRELGLPICFVGTGEKFEDLAEFDADKFIDGVLE